MTDKKQPESPEVRAERIKRIEQSIKDIDPKNSILPKTPEGIREVQKLSKQMDEAQRRFEKESPGLTIPSKGDKPRGR